MTDENTAPIKKLSFRITEEEEGERIDRVLAALSDGMSRTYIQRLLKDGLVFQEITQPGTEASFRQLKASYPVKQGDVIHLHIPEASLPDVLAQNIPLDILYEDEDLLVVNKPKGMVVHPAPGHINGTLVNAVLFHCHNSLSGIGGVLRPGIVHRIDRDTTGGLIVCKNDFTHQSIASQLKEHSIGRKYLGIVCGIIKTDAGTIDAPIGRHPTHRQKMAVLAASDASKKEAITHYQVLERYENHTYIECELETGRTHQIRVHMAHLGYPLLGDTVYGGKKRLEIAGKVIDLDGQCLHAATLLFVHPRSGEKMAVDAPLPGYFEKLMKVL